MKFEELSQDDKLDEFDFIEDMLIELTITWHRREFQAHMKALIALLTRAYDNYWTDANETALYRKRLLLVARDNGKDKIMVLYTILRVLNSRIENGGTTNDNLPF